jgi:hypothetical protein
MQSRKPFIKMRDAETITAQCAPVSDLCRDTLAARSVRVLTTGS